MALCAAFSAFCAIQWIFFAWFPTFLQERFGLSMTESGWNGTLFIQTSAIAGILTGGWLADRVRRRWAAGRLFVASIGVLLSAPFAYLTFSASSLNQARLFSAGFGLFGGLLAANAFAAAYDVLDRDNNRGLAAGILNMTGGISSAFMIYTAGIWKDTVGFAGMMSGMSTVAVAAALFLIFVAARQPLPEATRGSARIA
jgi:sugar phosphate permease